MRTLALLVLPVLLAPTLAHAARREAAARWEPADEVVDLYNKGVDHLNAGRVEAAAGVFRQVVARDPTCGACRLALVEAVLRDEGPQAALGPAEELAGLFPGRPDAQEHHSTVLFAAQRFEEALAAARLAVAADPKDLWAEAALVRTLTRLGRYEEAEGAVAAARAKVPDAELDCLLLAVRTDRDDVAGAEALEASCSAAKETGVRNPALSDLASLRGDLDAVAELSGDAGLDATRLAARGLEALQARHFEEALALFVEALRARPDALELRVNRAICLAELGRWADAAAELEKTMGMEAWVQVERKGTLAGILTYGSEKQFRDNLRRAASILVQARLRTGKVEAAEEALARAQAAYGEHPALVGAEVAVAVAKGDRARAVRVAEAGMARWPGDPEVSDAAGQVLFTWPDASSTLREKVASGGGAVERFNVAAGLFNGRDFAGCLDVLATVGTDPDLDEAMRLGLGFRCAVGAERRRDAASWRDQLRAADRPEDAEYNYAVLLCKEERFDEAVEILEALRPTDPSLDAARKELLEQAERAAAR